MLALAMAGCGSTAKPDSATDGDTLILGSALSFTGSLAAEGQLTKQGYDLCVATVNGRGGVPVGGKHYRLQIRYRDDGSKPDKSTVLVDQFNTEGIKLILGPYGSAANTAVAAVVERNQQVLADAAGSDDKIFAKGYRRTFGVVSPASTYAASIVRALVQLATPRPETVAFLSADDAFSKTVTTGGLAEARRHGLTVVGTEYFPSGSDDVRASLKKIKPTNPDVIIGSVHLVEGVAIIQQARELGIRPPGGIAETVAPPTPDFVEKLGAQAENVISSTQWTPRTGGRDEWFGTAGEYVGAFRAMFNVTPEYHNAAATAACLTLVLGIERGGSIEPDKVRDAMAKLDTGTFFGSIRFDSTGKNVAKQMSVIQIQHRLPVTVWPVADSEAQLAWPSIRG
ncbi:MAG TPA: amino acid ABC transporter substrate-binding protein [Mycobacteriales bacterium]|nr:amino acid ABC transporter substrate-binding protein [Mycobacteriales bacterium]